MDRIWILGVAVRCRVGVSAGERRRPQALSLDLGLEADCARAGRSDDFADAVDYQEVEAAVRRALEAGERRLLERLAVDAAGAVLACDRRIRAVTVRASKRPRAMPRVREVVVELRRRTRPRSRPEAERPRSRREGRWRRRG
ncbi:MAG: dihydroneopterin aldolase [Elusimicrobiota bacterium]|jgi:dihydroneopterin aldolase